MADYLNTENVETKQYIVTRIGDEQFGIEIEQIDNIVRMQKITRVPKAQECFNGIMNLRGEVVPVMSLRKRMGLAEDVITDNSRIVVLKVENKGFLGVIVDEVHEVVTLEMNGIDRAMVDSKGVNAHFIYGVGKHNDDLISLLSIEAIVGEVE